MLEILLKKEISILRIFYYINKFKEETKDEYIKRLFHSNMTTRYIMTLSLCTSRVWTTSTTLPIRSKLSTACSLLSRITSINWQRRSITSDWQRSVVATRRFHARRRRPSCKLSKRRLRLLRLES